MRVAPAFSMGSGSAVTAARPSPIVNPTTDGSARDDRPELRIVRGLAVGASADRLLEGGVTANQNAAVGLNLLLLTHLSTSA